MQDPKLACCHPLSRLHEQHSVCPWWLGALLPASNTSW